MPHLTRPQIDPRYPVQVTIRAIPGLPSLRSPRVFGALRRAIARASVDRFRVIHVSIQQDHGHFIVEGDAPRRARGGMHGLAIRFRKHLRAPPCIDPRSSGPHFSGWQRKPDAAADAAATALPSTWMARIGLRRAGGPLRVEERPAASVRPHPT
jgi:hypothetical protein